MIHFQSLTMYSWHFMTRIYWLAQSSNFPPFLFNNSGGLESCRWRWVIGKRVSFRSIDSLQMSKAKKMKYTLPVTNSSHLPGGAIPKGKRFQIHPQKLTWNLEMMVSNRNLIFQGAPIFRFHVCFGGCIHFSGEKKIVSERVPTRVLSRGDSRRCHLDHQDDRTVFYAGFKQTFTCLLESSLGTHKFFLPIYWGLKTFIFPWGFWGPRVRRKIAPSHDFQKKEWNRPTNRRIHPSIEKMIILHWQFNLVKFDFPVNLVKFVFPVNLVKFDFPVNLVKFDFPVNLVKFVFAVYLLKFDFPVNLVKFDFPVNLVKFVFAVYLVKFDFPVNLVKFDFPVNLVKFVFAVYLVKFDFPVNLVKFVFPVNLVKFDFPVNLDKFDFPVVLVKFVFPS